MENKRNSRIDKALNSLDGVQKAAAPDFFYTRLRARMEKGIAADNKPNWVLRPAFIFSVLLLIITVNAFVFLKNQDQETVVDNNETVQQSIAAEYNLYDINSVYDLNQDK
jgi:hypothetical protein